ncbi:translation elongation factor [Tardisphaera miroshnichenkoae]
MLTGTIQSVIGKSAEMTSSLADKLGKKHESDWVSIYYKKVGDAVRSVLVPRSDRILEQVQTSSLSDGIYLVAQEPVSWEDGELALLAEASGSNCQIVGPSSLARYFGELSIAKKIAPGPLPMEGPAVESGFTYVDRVFTVRGVGTVALGFAGEPLSVHDKLYAFPSGKPVEVRSIQVLDEDQESVGVGVRVGLALKGAELSELQDTYGLSRDPAVFSKERQAAQVSKFKWVAQLPPKLHAFSYGVRSMVSIGEDGSLAPDSPFPTRGRAILVDVNAKPRSPRVVGYAIMSGRMRSRLLDNCPFLHYSVARLDDLDVVCETSPFLFSHSSRKAASYAYVSMTPAL